MPIAYHVHHDVRVVVAVGHGILTEADVFGYQRDVWSRPEVISYDELIDMRRVTQIEMPSAEQVRDLAQVAAEMDHEGITSRLAIVASADLVFGLGRMFQTYRQLNPKSTKEVRVFRSMVEALSFLRMDHSLAMPELS
jgi:hypothetical protein